MHHKSWHVYSKDNQALVKKDERKFEDKEKQMEARIEKADSEARVRMLRTNAHHVTAAQPTKSVNFFEEEEKMGGRERLKPQKEIDQKKYEDSFTLFLGETKDGKKAKPWYGKSKDVPSIKEESLKKDLQRKTSLDPLEKMRELLLKKKAAHTGGMTKRDRSSEHKRDARHSKKHESERYFFNNQFNHKSVRESNSL